MQHPLRRSPRLHLHCFLNHFFHLAIASIEPPVPRSSIYISTNRYIAWKKKDTKKREGETIIIYRHTRPTNHRRSGDSIFATLPSFVIRRTPPAVARAAVIYFLFLPYYYSTSTVTPSDWCLPIIIIYGPHLLTSKKKNQSVSWKNKTNV